MAEIPTICEPQLSESRLKGYNNSTIEDSPLSYLCRTCLLLRPQVSSLFSQCSGEDLFINDMIMSLCSVQILPNDKLPNKICLTCFHELRVAYSFKKRCENADKRLKEGVAALFDDNTSFIENHTKTEMLPTNSIYLSDIDPLLNHNVTGVNITIKKERDTSPDHQNIYQSLNASKMKNNQNESTIKEEIFLEENHPTNANKKIKKGMCKKAKVKIGGGAKKALIFLPPDNKPYKCTKCEYSCITRSKFNAHMVVHANIKPYSCDKCSYKCARKGSLKAHDKIHRNEKPFLCDQCHYTAISRTVLKVHLMNKHSTERRFTCDYCGATYKTKSNLVYHVSMHMGVTNYSCNLCPYKSITLALYQNHRMMVHTKERPFACDQCPYRCTTKGYLKIHKRTHLTIKNFTCDQCLYTCHTKFRLKTHKLTHSNVKPYLCKYCDFKTAQSSSLTRHNKRIHPCELLNKC